MDDINAQSIALDARSETGASRAANYGSGTETARGLLNRPDTFSEGIGGGDPAMSQAIRAKYTSGFNRNVDRMNLQNLKKAGDDHLKKLEVATQMANEEHKMNFEKEMARKKAAQAKAAMRGQLLGSVLGIVGGVAGGVATGGNPMGIMAGAQLGSGTGQAIGSGG